MFVRRITALSLLLSLAACDPADRERTDARRFLSAYAALDHRDPVSEREREVEGLSSLPLHAPVVMKARDACVAAHRALIGAERAQELAASALERALAARPDGEPLSKEQSEKVQQSIVQAESALTGARTRFAPCEAEARALALRYAER